MCARPSVVADITEMVADTLTQKSSEIVADGCLFCVVDGRVNRVESFRIILYSFFFVIKNAHLNNYTIPTPFLIANRHLLN